MPGSHHNYKWIKKNEDVDDYDGNNEKTNK